MKYYNTPLAEQESLVNVLYKEQLVRIYSNRIETIKILTDTIGQPTTKYKKSKSYWCGASWDIDMHDIGIINKVIAKGILIDPDFKCKKQKIKKNSKNVQVSLDNLIDE